MKKIISISLLAGIIFLIGYSCKKETITIDNPPSVSNPYSNIDYDQNPALIAIDSTSYLGVHEFIFSRKCANPACHDGTFEPDFRTIQGSYNQLVYHPVIKNNSNNDFTYRVIPNNLNSSWLHERITTDDPVLGKMPLYDTLYPNEIKIIEDWINNGAPDMFGNVPIQPNHQPGSYGFVAFQNDTNGIRLDTNRSDIITPMKVPLNSNVNVWFLLYDVDVNGDFIPGWAFTYNKMKISENPLDFSSATEYNLTVVPFLTFAMLPVPFGGTTKAPYSHYATFNTSGLVQGRTYYMRVYVKDANHTQPTEIPENGWQQYLWTYYSCKVI